ncbi:alpha/beta fold hydrolase [Dactylosporangium siamense]|uniref:Epoxide hydrolase EphF n=1 Tax=Dactylosporangium siamense TaxID=685454 RepID=A0A919PQ32_9ACTN|nr:alpha/beta hydrolase [Dactylosporangium siamense]GIG48631.1 epoxide hydrolase EphF [Dactylosporangium siamense]
MTPNRPFPEVAGVTHRFVDVRGTRLHVAEAGAGTALVLLHGFPQHWYAWRHVIALLPVGYRLICPDLRGFGWSAPSRGGHGTEDRAADVVALLDALGHDRVGLVGHDWGAWAGFAACLRAPERFSRFIALNMMHPWPARRALITQAWRFWYTAVIEYPLLGRLVLRRWPGFTRFLLRRAAADPAVTWRPGELDEFAAAGREPGAAHAGQALHWRFVVDDIPRLRRGWSGGARLRVPTLIVGGARDVVIPPALLSTAGGHADDLTVEVVPGAGHQLPDERPDLVAARIRTLFPH